MIRCPVDGIRIVGARLAGRDRVRYGGRRKVVSVDWLSESEAAIEDAAEGPARPGRPFQTSPDSQEKTPATRAGVSISGEVCYWGGVGKK